MEYVSSMTDLGIDVLDDEYKVISINGPYAWEVLAELLGPEMIGMPYLSIAHVDRLTCFRAGKTGEYGYDLLVPAGDVDELWSRLLEIGERFDAEVADLETLDLCALEGWFFNIRREAVGDVTPIELQLQWRVSYRKEYVGSAALAERRRSGSVSRLVCLASPEPLEIGDAVHFREREVGKLINAGYSVVRNDYLALAMVDRSWAYPHLECLTVNRGKLALSVRTILPPALNNRSIYVSPQAHSYSTRKDFEFPSLTRGIVPCDSRIKP
jgi:aminomethyltransferase